MLLSTVLTITLTLASAALPDQWRVFKTKYGKNYGDEEDRIRKSIYQANLETIEEHNQKYQRGEVSYYLGENQFADMTAEEFSNSMDGIYQKRSTVDTHVNTEDTHIPTMNVSTLPATVDWRKKGWVTPVKNQGDCKSDWAFAATGAIEGQHAKVTGKLVSLSESQLVDCTFSGGNKGCKDGSALSSFYWLIEHGGIDTEASYPYKPAVGQCRFNFSTVGARLKEVKNVPQGNESALQESVATVGPISVRIDGSHKSFQLYSGGVYDEPECNPLKPNRLALVVGYGTDQDKDYWLVKNSWGTTWGEEGYIRMSRNKNNQCGIANLAIYPIVNDH